MGSERTGSTTTRSVSVVFGPPQSSATGVHTSEGSESPWPQATSVAIASHAGERQRTGSRARSGPRERLGEWRSGFSSHILGG